jgi:hypothetical protein
VGSQGTPRGRFQRALERGHALNALAAARELGWLPLNDSLSLLVLVARDADARLYERGAARWLGRFALEQNVSLQQLQLAAAALVALPTGSDAAVDCLEQLAHETGLPPPVRPRAERSGD